MYKNNNKLISRMDPINNEVKSIIYEGKTIDIVWKPFPVEKYRKKYLISNIGTVKSLKTGRIVYNECYDNPEQMHVTFYDIKCDKFTSFLIEYMVALAFIGPIPKGKRLIAIPSKKMYDTIDDPYYDCSTHSCDEGLVPYLFCCFADAIQYIDNNEPIGIKGVYCKKTKQWNHPMKLYHQ